MMEPWIPWFQAEAIELGPLVLQPFGLLAVAGTLSGLFVALQRAAASGVSRDDALSFVGITLPLGIFCGNFFNMIFYFPGAVLERPWVLLMPWNSQGSYGGFFGAILGAFIWKWTHRRPMLPVLDAFAFAMPVAWFFGRIGCFITHDHPGTVTSFVLAVRDYHYGAPPFLPRHDLGLYEVLWAVGCIALFHYWEQRPRPAGFFIGWLGLSYAPVRFLLDFLRVGDATDAWGWTPGQWASIAATILSFRLLLSLGAFSLSGES